jgi:dihydropteroate synthase
VILMGILNVTPDSFSDGGRYLDPQAAVRRALEMQEEGAGLIDIGGESTRPGSERIGEEEEWRRIEPVLELLPGAGLTAPLSIPVSIDTRNPGVAERALQSRSSRLILAINHVALADEPDRVRAMAKLASSARVALILMHVRGRLETMATLPPMADPVGETLEGLRALRDIALAAGLPQQWLLLDPGIGFGKNGRENNILLRDLDRFHELGCRLVVGPSRKSFLAAEVAANRRDAAADRDLATASAVTAAVAAGCHVLRIHNVRMMAPVVRLAERLSQE